MTTFLSGGTGTPKLLWGADSVFPPADTTVIGNTGDDIELGGQFVCPDLDTVLFLDGDVLDRETWWGIADDSATTHDELIQLAEVSGLETGTRYLPPHCQTNCRDLARWRRFSGVGEFMHIGDRDRAVHLTRTSLLDKGHTLTEVTQILSNAFSLERDLYPMSDDPVTTLIHTPDGPMHFQAFWVSHRAEPPIERLEFRGANDADPTDAVLTALQEPVIVGPSNPVTSIGPMLAMNGFRQALESTPVVAVSPFVEDTVFSGPAAELMAANGYEPSTAGVAASYEFVDAFVLDTDDGTSLDQPVVRTDISIETKADSERVSRACRDALDAISPGYFD